MPNHIRYIGGWYESQLQFERDNPPPPVRKIVCAMCGPCSARYVYKDDEGREICGMCFDTKAAFSFVRGQSVQPIGGIK